MYAYGAYDGGGDPLAAPLDSAAVMDSLGEAILAGRSPGEALTALARRGAQGRRGLEELLREVRARSRRLRRSGRLDGTLEAVRELLDTAVGQERAALFPDPADEARLAEAELDALPVEPARAVRALAGYPWRSAEARATYEQLQDLLRREVLDTSFQGISQRLAQAEPQDYARIAEMVDALSGLLEAASRGEDTDAGFAEFMTRYADLFPGRPATLDALVEDLARRARAAQQVLDSLSPAQRRALSELMAEAMAQAGLGERLARFTRALRTARPDLARRRNRPAGQQVTGSEPLGLSDATGVLAELAELDELAAALGQDYPGAALADIDPQAVARALGRDAVDDLMALRQIERDLERQGLVRRVGGDLELTPRALRRLGSVALARVFGHLDARGRGDHDTPRTGAAGEPTGTHRPWCFGDEQRLDAVATLRNAVARGARPLPGGDARPGAPGGSAPRRDAPGVLAGRLRLTLEDFEVCEVEARAAAAVCLLVDLSYSMSLRGTWGAAKQTALALHWLLTSRYPQDRLHVIGFSDYAREIDPIALAGLDAEMVQGTNLQHALALAGRLLRRYPDAEPVVLVVTDGEPTAHLDRDGTVRFLWPPLPETLELTLAEVDKLTRMRATINVFMLDDDPRLVGFVSEVARRNGGRVFSPSPAHLGAYVVRDYLRARNRGVPRR